MSWNESKTFRVNNILLKHMMKSHCPESCYGRNGPCQECRAIVEGVMVTLTKNTFPCYACARFMNSRGIQARHFQSKSATHRGMHMSILENKLDLPDNCSPCFGCGSFFFGSPIGLNVHISMLPQCKSRHERILKQRSEHLYCLSCDTACRTSTELKQHLSNERKCKDKHTEKLVHQSDSRLCYKCGMIFGDVGFVSHFQNCLGSSSDTLLATDEKGGKSAEIISPFKKREKPMKTDLRQEKRSYNCEEGANIEPVEEKQAETVFEGIKQCHKLSEKSKSL